MAIQIRRLGVFGEKLPTRSAQTVTPADFARGAIIGRFERKFDQSFTVRSLEEFEDIFGGRVNSAFFGPDMVEMFFQNVANISAQLVVVSHVGYTGTAIDAVQASANLQDSGPVNTLNLGAGRREVLEYGISGNRTGYTITNGDRFTTAAAGAVAATGVSSAVLDSVIGIRVGDIVRFEATGGTPGNVFKKITAINESTKTVTWVGNFESAPAAGQALQIGDVVAVIGFRLRTYRQSLTGVRNEVEADLGAVFCTMEPEVTDFYVENVHAANRFLIATDLNSATALNGSFPVNVATVTLLTAGADGTAPTTAAHWSRTLTRLDNDRPRIIANGDTTLRAAQQAIETYAKGRTDTPKVLINIPSNQTKTQLLAEGAAFQRSDRHLGVLLANHLKITDPFATSPQAPLREVPNVGAAMGTWIRVIGTKGVHFIPSVRDAPLFGVQGIVGTQFLDDQDRTDLANAGVNVIQELQGFGILMRNFFTLSSDPVFRFANAILMQDFIQVSAVDSLQTSENTPNSIDRIREDAAAIQNFLFNLWFRGSTGNAREGETFGQRVNADGTVSQPLDHFQVIADPTNNPQASINAGNRNLDVFFTFPAPAGSIRIGVGIQLLA